MSHTVPLVFHRGHATDYEQKAETYRQKTGAYIDIIIKRIIIENCFFPAKSTEYLFETTLIFNNTTSLVNRF
jgi:hypothetical protein